MNYNNLIRKLIKMKAIRTILLSAILLASSATAFSQVSQTVHLTVAGTLKDSINKIGNATSITNLTLTGYMDARDMLFIRDNMTVLAVLDLSKDTIVEYKGTGNVSYPANTLPEYAFYNLSSKKSKTTLTSIIFPENMISIGRLAFFGCSGLTSVSLISGITSIGDSAFSNCAGLREVINYNLSPIAISKNVFDSAKISTYELKVFSSSVSAYQKANYWKDFSPITSGGFYVSVSARNSNLGTVTELSPNKFYANGENVTITATPNSALIFTGWRNSKNNLISTDNPLALTIYQDSVLFAHFAHKQTLYLPEAGIIDSLIKENNINKIITTDLTLTGKMDARDIRFLRDSMPALEVLDLENIDTIIAYSGTEGTRTGNRTYPANEFPEYAFYNASTQQGKSYLDTILLPSSCTKIGDYAFNNCLLLKSAPIPDKVTAIGDYAFNADANLKGILLFPDSVKTIGNRAYKGCRDLTTLIFSDSLESIGNHAFDGCVSIAGTLIIPYKIKNIKVHVFYGCAGLTSVVLNSKADSIENGAFNKCTGLAGPIMIPDSTTFIGDSVFYGCAGLTSIVFNLKTESIGKSAFEGCIGFTNKLILSSDLKTVKERAFYDCKFTENLLLPSQITSIEKLAFANNRFTSVDYNAVSCSSTGTSSEFIFQGCTTLDTATIDEAVLRIPAYAFHGCGLVVLNYNAINCTNLGSYFNNNRVFQEYLTLKILNIGDSVQSIPPQAFHSAGLIGTQVFPASMVSIGDLAFTYTKIDSLVFPSGLTHIGDQAFLHCDKISGTVELPADMTVLNNYVFGQCINIDSIILSQNLISIGSNTFFNCIKISLPIFPPTLKTIGSAAFSHCSNMSGTANLENVTSIGHSAFYNCSNLTTVKFSDDLSALNDYLFYGCNELTGLDLPSKLTSIGEFTFYGCSNIAGDIIFPIGLISVGASTFKGCKKITSFLLPARMTTIGNNAFSGCTALRKITNLSPTPVSINNSVFTGVDTVACELIVPTASLILYQKATGWKEFLNITGGGISVYARVNATAFGRIDGLGNRFYNNGETITLSVISTSGADFVYWTSGDSIISKEPILTMTLKQDISVIAHLENAITIDLNIAGTLKNIILNKNATKITLSGKFDARDIQFMRDSMPNLKNINLSQAAIVTYTGSEGTYYDSVLTYPANEIPQYSFYNKRDSINIVNKILTSIILPDELTSIDYFAFYGCSGLNNVTLPEKLTSIKDSAFAKCVNLKKIINLNPTPIVINKNVFFHVDTNACSLEVPKESLEDYKKADVWKSFLVKAVVGTEEIQAIANEIILYPNPVKDMVYIRCTSDIQQITIYDISGKMLKQIANPNSFVEVNDLSNGIYLIKVKTSDGEVMQKIVKQ